MRKPETSRSPGHRTTARPRLNGERGRAAVGNGTSLGPDMVASGEEFQFF